MSMRPLSTLAPGRDRRRAGAVLATVCLLLSGCSLLPGDDPEPSPTAPATQDRAAPREGTLLPEGTTEVDVGIGESVQVSLPEGSLGVGDFWGVDSVGDPAVAEAEVAIGETVFGQEPAEGGDEVGGPQPFAVEITGIEAGESTVRVLYCTRTREVSEDCDQSQGTLEAPVEPVEIVVQVG